MRSMSIYELNADYVKFSRFMGIEDRKILRYVFRNAMLPQITGLALSIGTMVGGALDASDRLQRQKEEQQAALLRIEDRRGFRCTKCGRVYCMECLLLHAPDRRGGGKACPSCGGSFEHLE